MFSRYYQSELTYLRELGQEFARANPSLAKTFSDAEADPDVERLLEGFAFLTARIRERIDSALPEVIDTLGEMVIPQAFRPIPACSIVQFTPSAMAIRGHYEVEPGTELASREVQGTQCTFRTVAPVDLLPIRVESCGLDPSTEREPKIRVRMRAVSEVQWPEHGRLRFFLKGPLGLSATVLLWFGEYLQSVSVESAGQTHSLRTPVTLPGVTPDLGLLPWPDTAPDGLRLVQEYFTIAEKLLFVDVGGLDRLPEDAIGEEFDLVFHFRGAPALPERLPSDLFQLYCVPALNLFQADGHPMINDSKVDEHLLRPSRLKAEHAEVYSVDSVAGLQRKGSELREYAPFFAFSHLAAPPSEQRYYAVRRARSAIDDGTDTYLAVLTPADRPPDLEEEVLSYTLTCTNRKLPTELRPGDICEPTVRSPTVAEFRNITPVTRPTSPSVGAEKHWRLISHVALNTRALADRDVLRSVLAHYNMHEDADQQLYQANRLRIESIRAVKATHERRVFQRIPMFGLHTRVELDESAFASLGDAYLFGCALQRLFVSESPMNSFHRLSLQLHPSNQVFDWKPETGTQALL